MKYIYISGPVTGLDYDEAKKAFDDAEEAIRWKYGREVEVINPMSFCNKGEYWNHAMRKCIVQLMECNYIHMLPGFEKSVGARLEMTIAQKLGFGVCNDIFELVDYEAQDK